MSRARAPRARRPPVPRPQRCRAGLSDETRTERERDDADGTSPPPSTAPGVLPHEVITSGTHNPRGRHDNSVWMARADEVAELLSDVHYSRRSAPMSRSPRSTAKDQHVADFNSICDDVLTNRECSNARSEILVTLATDLRVACEQQEPRRDRVDETVGRISVAALRGDVITKCRRDRDQLAARAGVPSSGRGTFASKPLATALLDFRRERLQRVLIHRSSFAATERGLRFVESREDFGPSTLAFFSLRQGFLDGLFFTAESSAFDGPANECALVRCELNVHEAKVEAAAGCVKTIRISPASCPHLWLDRARSDRSQTGTDVLEHRVAVVSAEDGAARSRELRAGAAAARSLDHVDLPLRQRVDAAPGIEVPVDEARETLGVLREERLAAVRRDSGETRHRLDHRRSASAAAIADVVVKHLGRLAERLVVRDVHGRQQRGIHRLGPGAAGNVDGSLGAWVGVQRQQPLRGPEYGGLPPDGGPPIFPVDRHD